MYFNAFLFMLSYLRTPPNTSPALNIIQLLLAQGTFVIPDVVKHHILQAVGVVYRSLKLSTKLRVQMVNPTKHTRGCKATFLKKWNTMWDCDATLKFQ